LNGAVLVGGAGLIAGTLNALVGGGTFVTLPALIAVGVPSVQANTSSTVALYPSQLVSAWIYRDGFKPLSGVSMRALLIATLIGGAAGAILLLNTSSKVFDKALPWLMLVATLMLMFGRQWGEWLRQRVHIGPKAVIGAQTVLGVYGGYFGGAVGIMMMAAWGLLSERDFKDMNAPRTLLVGSANTVAAGIFIAAHSVYWREAVTLLLGAVAGGLFGAWVGRRAPARVVRAITLTVACGITVAFFVKSYGM
jgi:uncharacterized membrane protein YfcA